jgi:hypothetical protein
MLLLMKAPGEDPEGGLAVLPVGQETEGKGGKVLYAEMEEDSYCTVYHGNILFHVLLVKRDNAKLK